MKPAPHQKTPSSSRCGEKEKMLVFCYSSIATIYCYSTQEKTKEVFSVATLDTVLAPTKPQYIQTQNHRNHTQNHKNPNSPLISLPPAPQYHHRRQTIVVPNLVSSVLNIVVSPISHHPKFQSHHCITAMSHHWKPSAAPTIITDNLPQLYSSSQHRNWKEKNPRCVRSACAKQREKKKTAASSLSVTLIAAVRDPCCHCQKAL